MITIKSTAYTKEEVLFAVNVLHDGLQVNCAEFFEEHTVPDEQRCIGCPNKISCTELQSAYLYMLSKFKRMEAEEQLEENAVKSLELLDS